MLPSGTHTVAVWIGDPVAREAVLKAVRLAGFNVRIDEPRIRPQLANIDVLVCDLPPGGEVGAIAVTELWRAHPRLPILLYWPPGAGLAALAGELTLRPGVTQLRQYPRSEGEVEELKSVLLTAMFGVPELAVRRIVHRFLHATPAIVRDFARATVDLLALRQRLPKDAVTTVRKALHVSERRLRRECTNANVAHPFKLWRAIAFFFIVYDAAWRGQSPAKSARQFGFLEKRWWNLRAAVLSSHIAEHPPTHQDLVHFAVLALAAACGRPQGEARTTVEEVRLVT